MQSFAFEIKIIVFTLQRVQEGMSSYILISGFPKTNNESKNIINNFQYMCANSFESLEYMWLLNRLVFGVPYESVMIQEALLNFIYGDFFHVGLIDKNHNMNHNCYRMIGGPCAVILGVYVYAIGILQASGVTRELWQTEDFVSDLLILKFNSHTTI